MDSSLPAMKDIHFSDSSTRTDYEMGKLSRDRLSCANEEGKADSTPRLSVEPEVSFLVGIKMQFFFLSLLIYGSSLIFPFTFESVAGKRANQAPGRKFGNRKEPRCWLSSIRTRGCGRSYLTERVLVFILGVRSRTKGAGAEEEKAEVPPVPLSLSVLEAEVERSDRYHSAPIRKSRRGLKAKEKERSSDLRDQRERIHAKQLWKRRETHGAGAEEVAFVLAKLI
ncbi:hypothetical protein E6C27_scaffold46826G00010 [Cucumis melo var. makuwa]|uniref:Uncharacterized protein n=1 Tax=Cucumis melo var. makuwa TaxID=1194695 RepID=A0A5A7UYM3_CUCMM|nr:hypothetical protein E6C27_scaffold46826G00010 [Cucumis melo var. makuwa]